VTPILRAENVCAGYRGLPVLHGASLELRTGELCGLVGPNGSGKSTLLRVLAGQHRPGSGRVAFDGHDLTRRSSGWIARRIATTPQVESHDWPATVADLVLLGRAARRGWFRPFDADDRSVVERCLAETDLTPFTERRITELSAGEAQRVLIARALAQEPNALLLDEPTSHLDLKHQIATLDLVARLARERGLAVGIVLHDLEQAARWCDRVAILHAGRIVADGPPNRVFEPETLARVYDIPVDVAADSDGDLRIRARRPS
jgi:ABC-type cobalamin/Fe3+-siderophores transport system ATPase subunit